MISDTATPCLLFLSASLSFPPSFELFMSVKVGVCLHTYPTLLPFPLKYPLTNILYPRRVWEDVVDRSWWLVVDDSGFVMQYRDEFRRCPGSFIEHVAFLITLNSNLICAVYTVLFSILVTLPFKRCFCIHRRILKKLYHIFHWNIKPHNCFQLL